MFNSCFYAFLQNLNAEILQCAFLQIKESGVTRIAVDGQAGVGKTTFVKRVCYLWAKRVISEPGSGKVGNPEEYTLVLPIILKFINTENTLTKIFTSQLKCLTICEVCAVIKHQEENPRDTLLLLDGFDEYRPDTGQSFVENMILNKEYSDVVCITTARSHAVEQIKRQSSRAVQQHVRLCGFNEDQVKQYITQFCEYHGLLKSTVDDLMETLKKKPKLLEVAKIPIRTEMICVVWSVYGKLGDSMADLYEMFILHLITHWDKKIPTTSQFVKLSKDEILKSNRPLLLKVGKIANSWTKHNNLRITYNDKELEDTLEGDFAKLIKIGLLTKSYPSNSAEKWSFPHLTFQEYFIAYLLGNDEKHDYLIRFTNRCKEYHYRVLSKCELIFTFLMNKYPLTANAIITQLLQEETDRIGCKELIDIICGQFQELVNQATGIPLPRHLNLESHNKLNLKVLDVLFEEDQRRKESNLRHLSLDKPIRFQQFLDIVHITELEVTICNEEELKLFNQKIKHLCQLTSLRISSAAGFYLPDQIDIMKNINGKKLTKLSVTGPLALETVARNVTRFQSLNQMHVGENSNITDKTNGQKILSALKDNKRINQVSFTVMDLDDIIIKEAGDKKVMVRVKKLQPVTLMVTSGKLTAHSTFALHTLDLSRNNLEREGSNLGVLMVKVSGLRVLLLCDCNLNKDTIEKMVNAITKERKPCHLQTLSMGHYENQNSTNLYSAGTALGKLLKLMPHLEILDFEECKLESDDFDAMSDALFEANTKIHTLNLGVNDLGEGKKGGFRFPNHMPELQALKAGGPDNNDPIPVICGAIDNRALTKLRILDISEGFVESNSLAILGEHLPIMRLLEVISLKGLDGVNPKDYIHIYKNIPPSLKHLNLSSDTTIMQEMIDPYDILSSKHHLSNLKYLNVTLIESELEMLQELLEEINPNIKVYSNPQENIWEENVLNHMINQK